MKSRNVVAIVAAAMLLEGCYAVAIYYIATADESWGMNTIEIPYDSQYQARIRILAGQITKNSTCNTKPPLDIKKAADLLTSGWRIMATGTLADSLKSVSIGMPRTSRDIGRFTEDVIPANAPTTIKGSIPVSVHDYPGLNGEMIRETTYCTPPPAYFFPAPGEDYEAGIRKLDGLKCEIYLQQLGATGEVEVGNVPLRVGSDCIE